MSLQNDEEMFEEDKEETSCSSCRFRKKCPIINTIIKTLKDLELDMVKENGVDVDTHAVISYCPCYVYDPNSGEEIGFTAEFDDESE